MISEEEFNEHYRQCNNQNECEVLTIEFEPVVGKKAMMFQSKS